MLKKFVEGPNAYNNLRVFNLFMGFLHLIQAIAMYALSNGFKETLTTSFLGSRGIPSEGTFEVFVVKKDFIEIALGPSISLFLLLSAVAHFLLASPLFYEWYQENLKRKINYARWYEYALSSSVMIVVIGILCGMTDAPSLLLLFALNACMNLFGLMMELHNQNTKTTNWTSFIFGVFAGVIPWIVIAWYFISAVKGYEGENPIPDFVYGILISIFIFFNCFAINMYLQYKKVGPWKNYLFGEAMYIVLSLVAKSALAWQVFSGTLRG